MKISCTPLSVAHAMRNNELTQAQYFELIASAGAEATDIVDPACYGWFYQDVEKDKAKCILIKNKSLLFDKTNFK